MTDKNAVYQLTMSYAPEQDRILLRISTLEKSEYQLWMTRRFLKVLWTGMMGIMEKDAQLKEDVLPQVRDAVLAMQHQEAVQNADFEKPHAQGNRDLTSNTGPVLITGGALAPTGEGMTRLTLNGNNALSVNVNLNGKLLHAFCHMAIETAFRADWGLDLAVGAPGVVGPEAGKLH